MFHQWFKGERHDHMCVLWKLFILYHSGCMEDIWESWRVASPTTGSSFMTLWILYKLIHSDCQISRSRDFLSTDIKPKSSAEYYIIYWSFIDKVLKIYLLFPSMWTVNWPIVKTHINSEHSGWVPPAVKFLPVFLSPTFHFHLWKEFGKLVYEVMHKTVCRLV